MTHPRQSPSSRRPSSKRPTPSSRVGWWTSCWQGRPIPAWAWLNALAHRPAHEVGDLIGAVCDQAADRWARALVDIAVDLGQIAAAQAAAIRTDLFVPAELEALAGRDSPDDPGQLVRAVRRRARDDPRQPGTNPTPHPDQTPT